jgi:hypothetical protein
MSLETNRRIPSLDEVIRAGIDAFSAELFKALPGIVQKYNEADRTVDVLPGVARITFADTGEPIQDDLAVLSGVPVMFPSGGGCFVQFPIKKGDLVLLVFCDSSIDEFKTGKGGDQVVPRIARAHDISDAIAIPGLFTSRNKYSATVGNDMVVGKEKKTQVRISDSDVQIVSGGRTVSLGGAVAIAAKCDLLWDTVTTALGTGVPPFDPTTAPAALTALAVALTAVRTLAPNVESSNLKAD